MGGFGGCAGCTSTGPVPSLTVGEVVLVLALTHFFNSKIPCSLDTGCYLANSQLTFELVLILKLLHSLLMMGTGPVELPLILISGVGVVMYLKRLQGTWDICIFPKYLALHSGTHLDLDLKFRF